MPRYIEIPRRPFDNLLSAKHKNFSAKHMFYWVLLDIISILISIFVFLSPSVKPRLQNNCGLSLPSMEYHTDAGLILGLRPANERQRYFVTAIRTIPDVVSDYFKASKQHKYRQLQNFITQV